MVCYNYYLCDLNNRFDLALVGQSCCCVPDVQTSGLALCVGVQQ